MVESEVERGAAIRCQVESEREEAKVAAVGAPIGIDVAGEMKLVLGVAERVVAAADAKGAPPSQNQLRNWVFGAGSD